MRVLFLRLTRVALSTHRKLPEARSASAPRTILAVRCKLKPPLSYTNSGIYSSGLLGGFQDDFGNSNAVKANDSLVNKNCGGLINSL